MNLLLTFVATLALVAAKPKPDCTRSGGCGGYSDSRVVNTAPVYSRTYYPESYSSDCSRSGGCGGSSGGYSSRTYETQSYPATTVVRSSGGCSRSDGSCGSSGGSNGGYVTRTETTYYPTAVRSSSSGCSRADGSCGGGSSGGGYEYSAPVRSSGGCSRADGGCTSYVSRVVEQPVYTTQTRVVETPVYSSSPVRYVTSGGCRNGGCGGSGSSGGYSSRTVYESSPVVYRTSGYSSDCSRSGGCGSGGYSRRRRSVVDTKSLILNALLA